MAAMMLFIAVPVMQPAGPQSQPPALRSQASLPFLTSEIVSKKVSAIVLQDTTVPNEPAQPVTIEGWELVSEKKKAEDGSDLVTSYPRTVINSDIDDDGAVETVTLHTFLEMNTALQTFQLFRIHLRADVNDPGSIQEHNNILEAAKASGAVSLLEFCYISLPNKTFYNPSMDYRYYLNDDSVFFAKGEDAYRPARIEATADTLIWNYFEDSIQLNFSRKTFTSASLEDLVK